MMVVDGGGAAEELPKSPLDVNLPKAPIVGADVTSGFVRNAAAEQAAIAAGVATKAEIEARGGVNASGYYGDSYNPQTSLTDAEYAAAVAGKTGAAAGAAINEALDKKMAASGISGSGMGASSGAVSGSGTKSGPSLESQRQAGSAYALLLSEFTKYGLEALVTPLKNLVQEGLTKEEFSLALQNTDAYQKRFGANTDRIAKGLSALSPAEYIGLEDQYQNIMRNYGLPASYYTKGSLGVQEGFNKLLANDVSAIELEDRVVTAQKRVLDAPPEVTTALRQFYPDITNGDILAYTLDPTKGLTEIKRKITAAEIGGAAIGAGLTTSLTDAEYLRRYGVTAETAREGYSAIGGGLQRGSQLASIYGESPYTQATAEEEVFKLPGQTEAQQKRRKIIGLEKAEFGGQTGVTSGALGRDRAGSF
jgi:hypothetical protein